MTQAKATHGKQRQLTPEQLDRVAKIAKWMKTLNGQQVTDLLKTTPDQPDSAQPKK